MREKKSIERKDESKVVFFEALQAYGARSEVATMVRLAPVALQTQVDLIRKIDEQNAKSRIIQRTSTRKSPPRRVPGGPNVVDGVADQGSRSHATWKGVMMSGLRRCRNVRWTRLQALDTLSTR
ncbi:hypothetical protein [uncultured Methylobacterium sp.]|uniref:hypothetical protein n=1 Tax=uncultured Methylobacterium sp. TaxID=157278 RepID=UPI0035CA31DC